MYLYGYYTCILCVQDVSKLCVINYSGDSMPQCESKWSSEHRSGNASVNSYRGQVSRAHEVARLVRSV
jgi:hypothetical protein